MRAPKLLRPRPVGTTYVDTIERRNLRWQATHNPINLPVRDVVEALNQTMATVQQRVHPKVTTEVQQAPYTYTVSLRWQSPTDQLQLQGHADELGFRLRLTNSLGSLPWQRGVVLASWTCRRSDWSHSYGDLQVDRFEGNNQGTARVTYLSTNLPAFEKVTRAATFDYPSWQRLPERPDLIADIAEVTQVYASALS